MNDQPSPFDPAPLPAATETPAPEKTKRRATGKRPGRPPRKASTPTPVSVAPVSPKRRGRPAAGPRTGIKTKVPVTAPSALKLDFGTALAVASGLKPEDTELFGQIAVVLGKLGKKPRIRIAAALVRMFQ